MRHRVRITIPAAFAAISAAALLAAPSVPAAFPGTNGKIAFVHDPPGAEGEIFAMDPSGQNRTPLTAGPEREGRPSYSPDGEKIVFTRRIGSSYQEIWVMSHDGTDPTQLTSAPAPRAPLPPPNPVPENDDYPQFSPDGQRIVFEREFSTGRQVFIMNADGSGQTQLTFPGPEEHKAEHPTFSPDGQTIAFTHRDGTTNVRSIWVMNADGSGQTPLTSAPHTMLDADPDFSPDGQRIVFHGWDGMQDQVWVMNADGTGPAELTTGPDHDYLPVFSPDGTRIAFHRESAARSFGNIFLVDPTGVDQDLTPLTFNAGPNAYDSEPTWQPLNPPACALSGDAKSKSVKQVSVTVTCTNENATVVAEGSGKAPKPRSSPAVASKAKRFTIPPVTAQVSEDTPTSLSLTIPKKGTKALKKAAKAGKKGKATITATLTDDLGQASSDSFAIKFKPRKK